MNTKEERRRLVAMAEALRQAQEIIRRQGGGLICTALIATGHRGADDARELIHRALHPQNCLGSWIARCNPGVSHFDFFSDTHNGNQARIRWIDQLVGDIEKRIAEIVAA